MHTIASAQMTFIQLLFMMAAVVAVDATGATNSSCTKPLPTILIAGVARCGTSFLSHFLGSHKGVLLASTAENWSLVKAINSREQALKSWEHDYGKCLKPHVRAVVETNPWSVCRQTLPQVARDILPNLTVIISLRDPLKRIESSIGHHRGSDQTKEDMQRSMLARLTARVGQLGPSMGPGCDYLGVAYLKLINAWLAWFPHEQIIVTAQERISDDAELRRLERLLHLEPLTDLQLWRTKALSAAAKPSKDGRLNPSEGWNLSTEAARLLSMRSDLVYPSRGQRLSHLVGCNVTKLWSKTSQAILELGSASVRSERISHGKTNPST